MVRVWHVGYFVVRGSAGRRATHMMEARLRILDLLAALVALPAAAALITLTAEARPQRQPGTVSVCSLYGKGCITAPVRPGQYDYEVRLPGRVWISCARDCKQTLREQSIDFFETLRERAPGNDRN